MKSEIVKRETKIAGKTHESKHGKAVSELIVRGGTSLRHTGVSIHLSPSSKSSYPVLCLTPFSPPPSPSGTNVLGYGPRFSRRASYKWPLHAELKRIHRVHGVFCRERECNEDDVRAARRDGINSNMYLANLSQVPLF